MGCFLETMKCRTLTHGREIGCRCRYVMMYLDLTFNFIMVTLKIFLDHILETVRCIKLKPVRDIGEDIDLQYH